MSGVAAGAVVGDRKCLACERSLASETNYFNRYKVCQTCFKKKSFSLKEKQHPQRFCQKCGVPHDILAFDGDRKSCREGLKKHNEMRKKNRKKKKESEKGGPGLGVQLKNGGWINKHKHLGHHSSNDLVFPRQTPQLRPYSLPWPARASNNVALNALNMPHLGQYRTYSQQDYCQQRHPIREMLGSILSKYQEQTNFQKEVGFQQFQPNKFKTNEFFPVLQQFNNTFAQNQQRISQEVDPSSLQFPTLYQQQQYNQMLQQQAAYNWLNPLQRDNNGGLQNFETLPFQSQPVQVNDGLMYNRRIFQNSVNSGDNSNNETNMQFPAAQNAANNGPFDVQNTLNVGDCGEVAELFVTATMETNSNSQSDFSQQQTNQIINNNCYQDVNM